MILRIPVIFTDIRDWTRKTANAVNALIVQVEERGDVPFNSRPSEPVDPVAGQVYYDTGTNKARMFDGTGWNDLW